MTDKTTKIDSEEAKRALQSIRNLEGIALQRAMPARWFGMAIALVVGLLVFLIAAGLREYYIFPIIALPIIIAIHRIKSKALPRMIGMNKKNIIALVGIIAFMLALIFLAIYIRDYYGTLLGAIASGVIATLVVYWISWSERKVYQNKIDLDTGHE
jgi:O-antigen/teichoic acid export membrane protein